MAIQVKITTPETSGDTSDTEKKPTQVKVTAITEDYTIDNVQDGDVLTFDQKTGKNTPKSSDLIVGMTTMTNSGIPSAFINQLDIDLDDKISIDGGGFM